MPEYKCPKCQSGKITLIRKIAYASDLVRNEHIYMVLCADCETFLGVVNDTSKLRKAINHIGS